MGPLNGRRQERLLDRILRRVERPEPAHERTQHLRRQIAQQVLDADAGRGVGHIYTSGAAPTSRSSTGMLIGTPPRPGAAEMRAAISTTRSKLLHSRIQYPARNSFASANGPSVTATLPFGPLA